MKPKTDVKPAQQKSAQPSAQKDSGNNGTGTSAATAQKSSSGKGTFIPVGPQRKNPHGIPDYRLEVPDFYTVEEWVEGKLRYNVKGTFDAPAPSLCESKYLTKEKSIEMYRFMLLNRKMEQALENLFKQQKVIGGVYLGLGQEGCSVASAIALKKQDWVGPMIRNQGSMLVRGFKPSDTMMQYMAKAGAPTKGRDSGSHYGDVHEKNIVAPISHLGDSIGVMAGIALGARLQGKNIACLTFVGDGGQSTGPSYEGFNFAAVQKLGVILIKEHNLWAYSTPVELQFACKDLADRAIGYGVPGFIVDGTDPNQVYDVTYEAAQRAYKGEGATLIEAKMMRMRGHAMHDAASYVPKPYFDYWKARDCNTRMEKYLLDRGWLTTEQNEKLIADVQNQIDTDRDIADASPFPGPEDASKDVYLDNSHKVPFKYGPPKVKEVKKGEKIGEASNVSHYK
ncbi:MAG TPA: thiamine pyrophosphate-dependent dehydrogenase E1 component subunit alpha [Terriglobales bacterium]|nr:thiamine pyrophosphate-dependent dehydrogenase E1 component subunit alpha [Terriglobales bacterium]